MKKLVSICFLFLSLSGCSVEEEGANVSEKEIRNKKAESLGGSEKPPLNSIQGVSSEERPNSVRTNLPSDYAIEEFIEQVLNRPNNILALSSANPFGVESAEELQAMFPELKPSGEKRLSDGTNFIEYHGRRPGPPPQGARFWTKDFRFKTFPGRFAHGIQDGMTLEEALTARYGSVEACLREKWKYHAKNFTAENYDFPAEKLSEFKEILFENLAGGATSGDIDGQVKMVFENGKLKVIQETPNL